MNPINWATSYFITKYLKPCIPSIDADQIRMSLWAGRLELSNLDLKIPWTNSPKSILSPSSAFVQNVEIRIPWQKLLKGKSCIINIELSGVSLEFEIHSTRYTPQDLENYKASLLHELDISIRDLKKNLDSKAAIHSEGGGLIETIISSLRVQVKDFKVCFIDLTQQQKSNGFAEEDKEICSVNYSINVDRIELLPCNFEFVPLEENLEEEAVELGSSILNSIKTYFSNKEKMIELLPELQFKQFNIHNLTLSMTYSTEQSSRVLLNYLDINTSISLRNFSFISFSLSSSSISAQVHLSTIKLSANNQELKTLSFFLNSLSSLSKKTSKLNRSNWQNILQKCIKYSNKRSWYRIYRGLLWKKLYKELYYKHVLDLKNDKLFYSHNVYSIEELYRETYERNMSVLCRLAARELIFFYNKDIQRTDEACKQIYEEKMKESYVRNYYSSDSIELALIKEIEKLISYKYILKLRKKLQQRLQVDYYSNLQLNKQTGVIKTSESESKVYLSVDYALDIAGLNIIFKTDNSVFSENSNSDMTPQLKRAFHHNSHISKPLIFLESANITFSGEYSTVLYPTSCSGFHFSSLNFSINIEDITLYNMHIHDLNNSLFKKLICINQPTSISVSYLFSPTELTKPQLNIHLNIIDIDISINKPCIKILFQYIISILDPPSTSKYTKESEFLDLIKLPKLSFRSEKDYTGIAEVVFRRVTVLLSEKYASNVDGIMMEMSKIKGNIEWDAIKEKMNANVRMKYIVMVAGKTSHWNPENAVFENSPLLESYKLNLDLMKIKTNCFKVAVRGRIIDIQMASASLISLKKILDEWLNDPIKIPHRSEHYRILRINSVKPASIQARELRKMSIHINFDGICLQSDVKNSSVVVNMKSIDIQILQKCFESCIVAQFSEMSILDKLASKPSENILLHIYSSKHPKISSISSSDYLSKESIYILPAKAGFIIFKSHCKESFEYRNILNEFEIGLSEVYLTIEPELMHIWLSVIYEFVYLFSKNSSFSVEESGQVIEQKYLVHIQQGSVCFDHKNESIYLLCFRNLISCTDIYSSKLQVRIHAADLHFNDLTLPTSNHSVIICPSNSESSFDLNYTDFTDKLLQIRFKNLKIKYLNRVLNEIKELFNNHYPDILTQPYHIDELGLRNTSSYDESVDDSPKESLQIQILALNCTMNIPRNSASQGEMFRLNVEKFVLGYEMENMFFIDQKFDWERELARKDSGRKDGQTWYINSNKYVKDLQEFAAMEMKNGNLTLLKKLARKIEKRLNKTEEELEEFEPVVCSGFDLYYAKFDSHYAKIDSELLENILNPDVESFKIIHENQNAIRNVSYAHTSSQRSFEFTLQPIQINPLVKQKSRITVSSEEQLPRELIIQFTSVSISDSLKPITDPEDKLNFEIYIIENDLNFEDSQIHPMTIKLHFRDRVYLELFEDQFNLLIKTLSENFCENYISVLPLHSADYSREIIDINIEIIFQDILEISTLGYKLYDNHTLDEFKAAPWRLNELQTKKGLCDIELKDFKCKVHMYQNGRKDIYLVGNSLSLIDCRHYSNLINLGKIHWFYHADSEHIDMSESFEHTDKVSQFEMNIKLENNGEKSFDIKLIDSVLLVVPDLISEVNKWFSAPFDLNVYPNPNYVICRPSRTPPSLKVSILSKNSKLCLFESFEDPHRNNCILHVESADFVVMWMDDVREGPGRMDVSFKLDIESVYFLDTLGQRINKTKSDQSIMRSFKLQIDYSNIYTVFFKPKFRSSWVSSQLNVRFPYDIAYQVMAIVSFNTICWVQNCIEAIQQGSLSIKPKPQNKEEYIKKRSSTKSRFTYTRQSKHDQFVEPGKESNRLAFSLNIQNIGFTFTNDKEQPIFKCMLPDLKLGYHQETKRSLEDGNMALEINAFYFNHRVMSWEPLLQTTRFQGKYSKNDGEVYLDIEDCGEGISLYITPSLFENVATVYSYFSQKDVDSVRQIVSHTPYKLFNKTGLDIKCEMNQDDWLNPISVSLNKNDEHTIDEDILNKVKKKLKNIEGELAITGLFDRKTIEILFITNEKIQFEKVSKIGVDTPDIHISPLTLHHSIISCQNEPHSLKKFTLVYPTSYREEKIEFFGCKIWNKKEIKDEVEDETICMRYFLVTEVEWIPETAQKQIWLRSSITVINSTPNQFKINYKLSELEYKDDEILSPWDKNFVPIPATANGKLMICPLGSYKYTKKIDLLNIDCNKLISRKVRLSSTSGLLLKRASKRITIRESGKDTRIHLSFIPLICQLNPESKRVPIHLNDSHFYIALSLKKINHSASMSKHKRSLEHEKIDRLATISTKNNEKCRTIKSSIEDEIFKAECVEDDIVMNEYKLILTSIFSIINATPFNAKVVVKSKLDKSEPNAVALAQGETYHCFFVKFFSEISVQVEIHNCEKSEEFRFSLLEIKNEVKHGVRIIDKENRDSEFYLWMKICKDEYGCWQMKLYFPYWILNKTGQDLLFAEYERWKTDKITKNPEARDKQKSDIEELSYSRSRSYSFESEESLSDSQLQTFLRHKHSRVEESPELFDNMRNSRSETPILNPQKFKSKDYSPILPIIKEKPSFKRIFSHIPSFSRMSLKSGTKVSKAEPFSSWNEIEIFSPSKKITKIKVAIKSPQDDKPNSGWSRYFNLGNSGTSGYLEVKARDDNIFHFGVTIEKGQGIFDLTNIITFKPLYILLNSYTHPLVYKQEGCNKYRELPVGQHTPFYWPMRHNKHVLRVALWNELSTISDFRWSGAFSIDAIGENFIRLPGDNQATDDFLQVSVVESEPAIIINFIAQKSKLPYRLENHTPYEVFYTQNSGEDNKGTIQTRKLESRSRENTSQEYAWDEPVGWHELIIQIQNTSRSYYLDRICKYEPVEISNKNWHEVLESMKSMSGKLFIRHRMISLYERNCFLSGRILYLDKPYKKIKELKLENGCCDLTVVDELNFTISRCKTIFSFKAPTIEECTKWTKALQEAIYNCSYSTSQQVYIEIELQEATRVIHIKNFTGYTADIKGQHDKNCPKLLNKEVEIQYELVSKSRYNLKLSSINISFINSIPQEVFRSSFYKIVLDYTLFQEDSVGITLLVQFFKIDNQLLKSMSQVAVVSRSKLNNNLGRELKVTDLNNIFLFIMKKTTKEIHNISNFNFLIQPFDIHVDDVLIAELVEYFQSMREILFFRQSKVDRHAEYKTNGNMNIVHVSSSKSLDFLSTIAGNSLIPKDLILFSEKRIFIENFSIESIQFSLVIEKNTVQKRSNRPKNLVSSLAGLGLTFTTVDASDLTLKRISFKDIYLPTSKFTSTLISHYRSQAIRKVYNILGSFDLLGNPSSLLTSITQGFKELIINPYHTLMNKPKDFVLSIGKGTGGMVRYTMSGLLKSIGNISGFIGRGIGLISLDQHFVRIQMRRKYRKPKNFNDVIWTGMKQLGNGVVGGLTGVVVFPVKETRKYGLPGIVTGLGKGVLGTVTKPAAGIFDSISSVSSGLGNLARQANGPHLTERTRYPLPFYRDKVLQVYNEKIAAGQYYLSNFQPSHAREKIMFYHKLYRKNTSLALVIFKHAICVIRCKDFKGVAFYKEFMKEPPLNELETKRINLVVKSSSISLSSIELKQLNIIRVKSENKRKMQLYVRYDSIVSSEDIQELAWVVSRYFVRTMQNKA